jgi:asparagine synthase (glutamine-hydrolysing)
MVADVPVGAFLSGGIDSTAVVAMAREHNPAIRVFTVGFDVDGYSEIELAEAAARELGVHLTSTVVTPDAFVDALPRIIWHLDDPVADPALVPLYFLAKKAAEQVTVVLSGEGADELFAGYEIYREPAALAAFAHLPGPLRRGLRAVSAVIPEGVKGKSFLQRATTPIEERFYGNARIFTDRDKRRILREHHIAPDHTELTAPLYAEAMGLDDVATMQYVDLNTWLPGDILTKADRMSMAHSLELRVPYLDRAVFEVAARLDTPMKLPPGSRVTKYALRQALREVVPSSTVDRPKLGFPTPIRVWLRGELGDWAHDVLARSGAGELLDLGYARRLLAAHQRGQADHSRKLWTVLMFCLWHAIAVERSLVVQPLMDSLSVPR